MINSLSYLEEGPDDTSPFVPQCLKDRQPRIFRVIMLLSTSYSSSPTGTIFQMSSLLVQAALKRSCNSRQHQKDPSSFQLGFFKLGAFQVSWSVYTGDDVTARDIVHQVGCLSCTKKKKKTIFDTYTTQNPMGPAKSFLNTEPVVSP